MKTINILLSVILLFTLGCATHQTKALSDIRVGMDKADVLEALGNPDKATREHGLDRWSYKLESESGNEITYIFFDSGKVSYVGPKAETGATKVGPTKSGFEKISE